MHYIGDHIDGVKIVSLLLYLLSNILKPWLDAWEAFLYVLAKLEFNVSLSFWGFRTIFIVILCEAIV